MAEEIVEIKLDAELKAAAERIYNKRGITLSDAINIFVKKTVALGAAPFYIKTDKKSARGILSQYANSSLVPLEDGAWERAAIEKYVQNAD